MNNFTYERLHNNLQYLKLNTIEELFLTTALRLLQGTTRQQWKSLIICLNRKRNTEKLLQLREG